MMHFPNIYDGALEISLLITYDTLSHSLNIDAYEARFGVGSLFYWENIILCILKGDMPFKMTKIIVFQNKKKIKIKICF